MPVKVTVGNDVVTFPDGMSDADMKAALDKEYGGANNTEATDAPPPVLKADQGLGLKLGLKRPMDNIATWIDKVPGAKNVETWAHNNLGMATSEQATAATQADVDAAAAQGRRPGAIGQTTGAVVAAIPITAVTRNPWLAGALSGAASTAKPNDPKAVAFDTGAGMVAGGGTSVALRGLGAAIAPRINPLVRRLLDRGVELTPGQILGGMTHRMEDATRSILGIGDMVGAAQGRAQQSMVRAAVQQSLDPLGVQIPRNIPAGHEQVRFAGDTLSGAYDNVLASVDRSAAPTGSTLPVPPGGGPPTGLHLDAAFGQNVANLRNLAAGLPADQRHVFEAFVNNELRHPFNPQTGSISGQAMKDLDSLIGQRAANYRSSPNPHDRDMGRAFQQMQAELRDMVGRQFPQHAAAIDAINQGWAHLVRVETAAAPATNGVFTTAALRSATRSTDRTMRHRASARGEALGQDFANAADSVMHAAVGDSGTATRALASAATAAALFGKSSLHNIQVNPWVAGLIGAVAAPYANRTTGAIARAAIASRPAGAAAARRAIERASPVASVAAGAQPARRD